LAHQRCCLRGVDMTEPKKPRKKRVQVYTKKDWRKRVQAEKQEEDDFMKELGIRHGKEEDDGDTQPSAK